MLQAAPAARAARCVAWPWLLQLRMHLHQRMRAQRTAHTPLLPFLTTPPSPHAPALPCPLLLNPSPPHHRDPSPRPLTPPSPPTLPLLHAAPPVLLHAPAVLAPAALVHAVVEVVGHVRGGRAPRRLQHAVQVEPKDLAVPQGQELAVLLGRDARLARQLEPLRACVNECMCMCVCVRVRLASAFAVPAPAASAIRSC